jgi:hypothetical protein
MKKTLQFLSYGVPVSAIAFLAAYHSSVQPAVVSNSPRSLVEKLRTASFSYAPSKSVKDLGARSDVVVVARPVAVRPGRTFDAPRGDVRGKHTIVTEYAVEEVLKGNPAKTVFVEQIVAMYAAEIPADPSSPALDPSDREPPAGMATSIIFLANGKRTRLPVDARVFDEGAGVVSGGELYTVMTPQGIVVDAPDGAVQPLAGEDEQLFPARTEFAKAVEQTRSEVAGQAAPPDDTRPPEPAADPNEHPPTDKPRQS